VQHSESTRHLSPPFTRSATTTTPDALYRRKGAPASAHAPRTPSAIHSPTSVFRPPSSPRVSPPMAVRYLLSTHGEPCNCIRCVTDDTRPRVHIVARSTHENVRASRRFTRRPTGRRRHRSSELARGGDDFDGAWIRAPRCRSRLDTRGRAASRIAPTLRAFAIPRVDRREVARCVA
jgi:hypothetical protein